MNVPSGIAQLRKTSEQTAESSDAMNLDDYICSENVSTPAGMSPPRETNDHEQDSSNAVASAIPIKMRKEKEPTNFVPQSVPIGQHGPRGSEEFGYVQRHVRKTSIDERRVSSFLFRNPLVNVLFATFIYANTLKDSETAGRFLTSSI